MAAENQRMSNIRATDVKTQIAVLHLQRIVDGDWPWPAFTAG